MPLWVPIDWLIALLSGLALLVIEVRRYRADFPSEAETDEPVPLFV